MIPPWLSNAEKEMGVKEISGPEAEEKIVGYHSYTSLKATSDEVPWCAAFVCAMLERAGIPSPRSARAYDFVHWGVLQKKPTNGCVIILKIGSGYHVGFYVGETPTTYAVLGGNQHDCVSIVEFKKDHLMGFRLPSEDYWNPEIEYDEPDETFS